LNRAHNILQDAGRIQETETMSEMVKVNGKPALVQETPRDHKPANILGLLMLERMGLQLRFGGFSFSDPNFQFF